MGIKDLPKPGLNFRTTAGAGNFQRKLSGATRYGDLKNLRDNQKAIVEAVEKYQGVIRTRGGLSRLQQLGAWREIKAKDRMVTKEDKREIKQVLKHLGRGAVSGKKIAKGEDSTKEQIRRNIARSRYQGERSSTSRQVSSRQYGGGTVQTSSLGVATNNSAWGGGRVKGTMADLNIKRGDTSFAQKYNENKPADKPAPQTSPGGVRPIGM